MKEVKNGKIIIKFSIMWFFIAIIIIALIISFFKNRIFATNTANKEEQTIVAFEENQKSIDVIEVMLENTNSDKKMVNEQNEIQEIKDERINILEDLRKRIESYEGYQYIY